MKTKQFFSLAALALMMAACSSDDIATVQSDSKVRTVPFKAVISADAGTRGLSEATDGKTITVDWEKDEQLIFAAVNHVAGQEVRALPYLHWWTFMGYFQSIDRDDLWATVLLIRQKKARGRRLEPYERQSGTWILPCALCRKGRREKRLWPYYQTSCGNLGTY